MSRQQGVLLVVAVGLIAAIGYFLLRDQPETHETVAVPVQPAPIERMPEPAAQAQEAPDPAAQKQIEQKPKLLPVAPSINESHEYIVAVVNSLSPSLTQWLVSEELLRKWVILIDQIADGSLSQKHLPVSYEMAPFAIEGNAKSAAIARENYARATPLVKAFTQIKPEVLVAYYRHWQPLLDKAYAELGKSGTFEERVMQAIRQMQSVPQAPQDAEIHASPVMYKYVDPAFEKAPALHKWMWRLGPENQSNIKSYLTQVKLALYRQAQ
ncbi:DUF3014 domain-containing protein [Simiduia sp. 21SJ11W-1]|uniref:DUF3014 domain-containing protein n=1 Tax=Simiduia sp. 21SJ11W-1 TaxID=2909669 RepID=UPI00209DA93D|nr:DUF3014 domain-containing protein [Simiduia sp. 21SJ11W-1]UTA46326.1 DUF3014 domain-containing protein [Simiduia sp. 21SJ11W-1]